MVAVKWIHWSFRMLKCLTLASWTGFKVPDQSLPFVFCNQNCDYISLRMYCVWMVVSVQWTSIISFFFGIAKWLEPSCQSWLLVQFKWSAANLLMSWWLRPLFILSMENPKHNSRFFKWCVTEFNNAARFSGSSALIRMVLHEKWHGFAKLAFYLLLKYSSGHIPT